MSKFSNVRKSSFIRGLPQSDVDNSGLISRSKVNFSFFCADQEPASSFYDFSHEDLCKILVKIQSYTKESLNYWRSQRTGSGGLKVFVEYGEFPTKSDFSHPPHVPHDVVWSRFRLDNTLRLIGFLIPSRLEGVPCGKNPDAGVYDRNTFYVVFLDKNHKFYKTESK